MFTFERGSLFLVAVLHLLATLPMCGQTAQELADHAYVRSKAAEGEHYALNLANPREYRFYMSQLAAAGLTKEMRPQFFRVIEQKRAVHAAGNYRPYAEADFVVRPAGTSGDDPISVVNAINTITSVTAKGPSFGSTAVSSIAGGTQGTVLSLGLYDAAMDALLNLQFGGGNDGAPLYSIVSSAQAASTAVYAQYTYTWIDQSGNVRGPFTQRLTTTDTLPTLTNQAPLSRNGGTAVINVCVNRTGCDYGPADRNGLLLPLRGHAVYPFGLSLTSNNVPTGGTVFWKLIDATVGGGCSAFGGANSIASFFVGPPKTTVTPNADGSAKVAWDWSSTLFDLTGTPCYTNGHRYNFVFLMNVPAPVSAGGPAQSVPIQVSTSAPEQPGPNTARIGEINVSSGCLAPGTAISLADGSTLPIEKFTATGEKVRSGGGRALTVANYTQGPETRPMVRIVSDRGFTLLLTEDHPVITSNRGAVAAGSLSTADTVTTDAGPSRLTSVTRVPYHGPVHNLDVGVQGEPFASGDTTMYANHILVGDWKMQNAATEAIRRSPEHIYAGLAPEWREDYLNQLEPAVAARLRAQKPRQGSRP